MKPWLWLPPQLAHDLSPLAVQLYSLLHEKRTPEWSSFSFENLRFKNRLGLAGGVDKNADLLPAWERLGSGFIEVGTVTPLAQKANPGTIFDRSIEDGALWNKMGFPSIGADEVYYNIKSFKPDSDLPLLVNIGKNRQTPNDMAAKDYVYLIQRFNDVADAFVVNISSPNTTGLRDLAKKESLESFLKPITEIRSEIRSAKPVLLKLSPDLETDDLKRIIDVSVQNNINGFVLTNTTLARETKKSFPAEGGLSGKPVSSLSKIALRTAVEHLGSEKKKKLLISVGGVMTIEDVFERLSLGADLVEVYTTLIFSGLNFFRKVEKAAHESKFRQHSKTEL
ncbi:MAG: quinone-dependent dihydroorotate dehydrogenase [Pseudobdellovibrio sp.]